MIAFPVSNDSGLWSPISPHFGKAPGFVLVDMDTEHWQYLDRNKLRETGESAPFGALSRLGVKEILCRSLGRDALERCREEGIQVVHIKSETVTDAILELNEPDCSVDPRDALCKKHDCDHSGCAQ